MGETVQVETPRALTTTRELVQVFNSLVSPTKWVRRFADRLTAVRRITRALGRESISEAELTDLFNALPEVRAALVSADPPPAAEPEPALEEEAPMAQKKTKTKTTTKARRERKAHKLSPAGLERLRASMNKRWAKYRAAERAGDTRAKNRIFGSLGRKKD